MRKLKQNKGITLIALIITIIVMLLLVGATISIAINGGLFGKGEKAAFQTKVSTIREQFELVKAEKAMENDGKTLLDYSGIQIKDLQGLDKKTRDEFEGKIVLDKNGNVCYNPAKVTDEEERKWLEEIGIKAFTGGTSTYKFYGTEEVYMAITPDSIILKDNVGDWLEAGESLKFEEGTIEEFFGGEFFNSLSAEEKQEIEQTFTQMEQAYGEVTTLLYPYIEGELSEGPMAFITDGSKVYLIVEGVIELEKNEELKNKLVKKKSYLKVFAQEIDVAFGDTHNYIDNVIIVDTENKIFSYNLVQNGNGGPLVIGDITTNSKLDSDITIITDEGITETIKAGADKIVITNLSTVEGPVDEPSAMCAYIYNDSIYLEVLDEADGSINSNEQIGKMSASDYDLSIFGLYLED